MATAATETVVKDDVFLPDATDSSKSKTSRADDDSASSSSPVQPLKIPFAPGDHITRWEMLPIAWPIQVHGIVLEVHSDSVLLVDFGLAAALDPAEEKDGGDDDEEQEENKKQHRVKSAIESFQKSLRKKERQRLNVRTLTEQKDISKWSKVNYDGGLFGFGDGEKQEDSNAAEKTKNEKKDYWWKKWKKIQTQKNAVKEKQERAEQEVSHVGSTPDVVDKQGKIAQSKTDTNDSEESSKLHVKSDEKISWWGLFSRQSHKKEAVEECSSDDDLMDILQEVGSHENAKENDIDLVWELERRIMRKQLGVVNVAQKASADTDESHPEPEDPNKRKEQNDDTEQSDNDTEQEKQKDGAASNVNTSAIPDGSIRDNPIDTTTAQGDVKNDSEEKKDEKVADIENDDKVAPKATVEENKESTESTHMRKLSRADPPTLVLARTNWLLQHGESILPPYHAFSSNSECMAGKCSLFRRMVIGSMDAVPTLISLPFVCMFQYFVRLATGVPCKQISSCIQQLLGMPSLLWS
jgi:hypothetical protein